MKCNHCHGFGNIAIMLSDKRKHYRLDPCPQCHGSGVVSCCEGVCEQPEPRAEDHERT